MLQETGWRSYVAETLHRSPLFSQLYVHMQQDQQLMTLLDLVEGHQPSQILFFATVMFLLQTEAARDEPLRQYYPYFSPHPLSPEEAYSVFRAFCLENVDQLELLLPFVRLQTNESLRFLALLFAFHRVFERGVLPLAMIEIGTSMGLNLNWHHYSYHFEDWHTGDLASPVQLHAVFEGSYRPLFPPMLPQVASIQGIELLPLDRTSEIDIAWVRACIWPEEIERYPRLDAALLVAEKHPPLVHHDDTCKVLPALLVI